MIISKLLFPVSPLTLVELYLQISILVILLNIVFPFLPNNKLRYYGGYVVYILTTSTLTILYIPVLLLRPRNPNNTLWAHPAAKYLTKILGIRWELRGEKILKEAEGAVICINHQSIFDILGIVVNHPAFQNLRIIARKEVFYYWPFGLGAWLCGAVFIDRQNGKEANKILDETVKRTRTNKTKIIMFPEGTRNRKGETLLPFKRGAFRIAIEGSLPIIPVVYSPYHFIDSEEKKFGKGCIIIQALSPIPTDGLTALDVDSLMQKTRDIMEVQYQKLRKEVNSEYGAVTS